MNRTKMKTLKYYLVAFVFIIASQACTGQERMIDAKDLPQKAQDFVKEHFGGKTVTFVQKDKEGLRMTYDVLLNDGVKLEFDSKGEWIEIDCKPQAVPTAIVPSQIMADVKQKYPETKIVQMERSKRRYEIDLSNGLEIRYDKQFKVVGIDD